MLLVLVLVVGAGDAYPLFVRYLGPRDLMSRCLDSPVLFVYGGVFHPSFYCVFLFLVLFCLLFINVEEVRRVFFRNCPCPLSLSKSNDCRPFVYSLCFFDGVQMTRAFLTLFRFNTFLLIVG